MLNHRLKKPRIQLYLIEKIDDKSPRRRYHSERLRNLNLCSIYRTFPPKNVTSLREKIEDRSPDKKKKKRKECHSVTLLLITEPKCLPLNAYRTFPSKNARSWRERTSRHPTNPFEFNENAFIGALCHPEHARNDWIRPFQQNLGRGKRGSPLLASFGLFFLSSPLLLSFYVPLCLSTTPSKRVRLRVSPLRRSCAHLGYFNEAMVHAVRK